MIAYLYPDQFEDWLTKSYGKGETVLILEGIYQGDIGVVTSGCGGFFTVQIDGKIKRYHHTELKRAVLAH